MKGLKRVIPPAHNSKDRIYAVRLVNLIWLKNSPVLVKCTLPDNVPAGRYLVYNNAFNGVNTAYSVNVQPVMVDQRNREFDLLLRNVEPVYRGSISLGINDVIAEAVSF